MNTVGMHTHVRVWKSLLGRTNAIFNKAGRVTASTSVRQISSSLSVLIGYLTGTKPHWIQWDLLPSKRIEAAYQSPNPPRTQTQKQHKKQGKERKRKNESLKGPAPGGGGGEEGTRVTAIRQIPTSKARPNRHQPVTRSFAALKVAIFTSGNKTNTEATALPSPRGAESTEERSNDRPKGLLPGKRLNNSVPAKESRRAWSVALGLASPPCQPIREISARARASFADSPSSWPM